MTKTKRERDYEGIQDILDAIKKFQELNKKHQEEKEKKDEEKRPPSDEIEPPSLTPDERSEGETPPEPKLPRDEVNTTHSLLEYAEEINKNSEYLGVEGFGELKMGKFQYYFDGNVFDDASDISRRIAEAPTADFNADLTDVTTFFNKKLVDTNLKLFDVTNGGVYTTYENSVREASTENTQTPQQVKPGEGITPKIVDPVKDVNDKLEPDPITTPDTLTEWNTDQDVKDPALETDLTKQIEENTGPNREGFINDKPTTGIQDRLLEAGFEPEQLTKLQQAYVENYGARDDRLKKIFSIFGGAR